MHAASLRHIGFIVTSTSDDGFGRRVEVRKVEGSALGKLDTEGRYME